MGNSCISENRKRQRTQCQETEILDERQHFRTVQIKCSTYFAEKSRVYYANLINQIYQQNMMLHFNIKIASYLEDDQSYSNISQILQIAHHASQLQLDSSNSLLRKRRLFKIIKEQLPKFYQLKVLHFNFGFLYIPNSTISILLEGIQKCKHLEYVNIDVQLDIYIKKYNDKKKDNEKKKTLPNDKIAYYIMHCLYSCKSINRISLNFSQIQISSQDYNSFFNQLKLAHHIRYIELIMNNCSIDDSTLEILGSVLFDNEHNNNFIKSFILQISNNSFKKINSFFLKFQKSNQRKQNNNQSSKMIKDENELTELGIISSNFDCRNEDRDLFFQQLIYFPKLTSFIFCINSFFSNEENLMTQKISGYFSSLNSIVLHNKMFSQYEKANLLKYWRKKKQMVNIQFV